MHHPPKHQENDRRTDQQQSAYDEDHRSPHLYSRTRRSVVPSWGHVWLQRGHFSPAVSGDGGRRAARIRAVASSKAGRTMTLLAVALSPETLLPSPNVRT